MRFTARRILAPRGWEGVGGGMVTLRWLEAYAQSIEGDSSLRKPTRLQEVNAKEKASACFARNDRVVEGERFMEDTAELEDDVGAGNGAIIGG